MGSYVQKKNNRKKNPATSFIPKHSETRARLIFIRFLQMNSNEEKEEK